MKKLYCELSPPVIDCVEQLYFGKNGSEYDFKDVEGGINFDDYIVKYLRPYLDYIKKVDGFDGIYMPQSWVVWEYDSTVYKYRLASILSICNAIGLEVIPILWSNKGNLNPMAGHLSIMSACLRYGYGEVACVDRELLSWIDSEATQTNELRGTYSGEVSLLSHWTGSYVTTSTELVPYSGVGQYTSKLYEYSSDIGHGIGGGAILNSAHTSFLNRTGVNMSLMNTDFDKIKLPPLVPAAFAYHLSYHPGAAETSYTASFFIDTYGSGGDKYFWTGKGWSTTTASIDVALDGWTNTIDLIEKTGGNGNFSNDLNGWTKNENGSSLAYIGNSEGANNGKAVVLDIDATNSIVEIYRALPEYDNNSQFVISFLAMVDDDTLSPQVALRASSGAGGGNSNHEGLLTEYWKEFTFTVYGRADGTVMIGNGSNCDSVSIYIDNISVKRYYAAELDPYTTKFTNLWFETYDASLDDNYRCTLKMSTSYTGTLSVVDYGLYLCGSEPDVRSYFNPHNGATVNEIYDRYQLMSYKHAWKGNGLLYGEPKGVKDPSQTIIKLPNPGMYRIKNVEQFFTSTRGTFDNNNLTYFGGNSYITDVFNELDTAVDAGLVVPHVVVFERPFGHYTPTISRYDQLCVSEFIRKSIVKINSLTLNNSFSLSLMAESSDVIGIDNSFYSLNGTPTNSPMSVIKHRLKSFRDGSIRRLYGSDTGSGAGLYEFLPVFDTQLSDPTPLDFDPFLYQVIDENALSKHASRYASSLWSLDLDTRDHRFLTSSEEHYIWKSAVLDTMSDFILSAKWNKTSTSMEEWLIDLYDDEYRDISFKGFGNTGREFFGEGSWNFITSWLPKDVADKSTYEDILGNGSFTLDTAQWTITASGGASTAVVATGGYDNGKYFSVSATANSDVLEFSITSSSYYTTSFYEVSFYAKAAVTRNNANIRFVRKLSNGTTADTNTIYLTDVWKKHVFYGYGDDSVYFDVDVSDTSNLSIPIHIDGISVYEKDWRYNGTHVGLDRVEGVYESFDPSRKVVFYTQGKGEELKALAGFKLASDSNRASPLGAPIPYQFSANYSVIYGGTLETPLLNGAGNNDAKNIVKRRSVDANGYAIDIAWAADSLTGSYFAGSVNATFDLGVYSFDEYEGEIGRITDRVNYYISIAPGVTRIISSKPSDGLQHRVSSDWNHMWNMLPDFWINNYDDIVLDTYESVWAGAADIASNMLGHLYQYDFAKSIISVPIEIVASNEVVTIDESTHYSNSSFTFSSGESISGIDRFFIHSDISSIPYMVDGYSGILTTSYTSYFDYEITGSTIAFKDGISTSLERLFAPWISYDEKLIYSNFGYLIDFRKPESDQYKDVVMATMYGLFGGHTLHAFRTVAEALAGLPLVPYTGKIYYAEAASTRFVLGIEDMYGSRRTINLPGVLTPSSAFPLIVRTGLTTQISVTDIRSLIGIEVYGLSAMSSAFDIYDRVTQPTRVGNIANAIKKKGIALYHTIIGEIQASSVDYIAKAYEDAGFGDRADLYKDLIYLFEKIKAEYHDILLFISQRPEDKLGIREARPSVSSTLTVEPTFDHNMVLYMEGEDWADTALSGAVSISNESFENSHTSSIKGRSFGQRQDNRFPEIGFLNTSSVYSHIGYEGLVDFSRNGRGVGFRDINGLSSKLWKMYPRQMNWDGAGAPRPNGGFSQYTHTQSQDFIYIPDDRASVAKGLYATMSGNYAPEDLNNLHIQGSSQRGVYFDGASSYFAYDHQTTSINELSTRPIIDVDSFLGVGSNPEESNRLLSYSPTEAITVMARVKPNSAGIIAEMAGELDYAGGGSQAHGSCCYGDGEFCNVWQFRGCVITTEAICLSIYPDPIWNEGGSCPGDCEVSDVYCIRNDPPPYVFAACVEGTADYIDCWRYSNVTLPYGGSEAVVKASSAACIADCPLTVPGVKCCFNNNTPHAQCIEGYTLPECTDAGGVEVSNCSQCVLGSVGGGPLGGSNSYAGGGTVVSGFGDNPNNESDQYVGDEYYIDDDGVFYQKK